MKILTLQCESTGLRATLVDAHTGSVLRDVVIPAAADADAALRQVVAALGDLATAIAAVGHRIFYGGARFVAPVTIDDALIDELAALAGTAAACNAPSLAMVRAARLAWPTLPQVAVFATPAFIASETLRATRPESSVAERPVPIAISARHIHLTTETIERLFGPGHELRPLKPLSQPGQYASQETLTLVGPKGKIENVRVLGPPRSANQVEISRTDEFTLGIDAPVRGSGDLEGTPGVTLVSDRASVTLEQGLICAQRHVHMTPADAKRWGVADGDLVDVAVDTDGRDLEFSDVLIRVHPNFHFEMHIDTDEANAADLNSGDAGVLVDTGRPARLVRKPASGG